MDTLQILLDFFTGYGYLAVFAVLLVCGFGVPIPEDITLVAGGVISGLGYTNVHYMFLVGMAGVLVGDGIMFMAGRTFGNKVLKFRPIARILTQERFEAVQEKFAKYGNWVLFVARFLPGLRSPIFITAGMTRRVPYWRFLLMDGFAALISVPVWVYLGYYGAANREWLMTMVHRGQAGILGAVALLLLVVGGVWLKRRRVSCAKK
ncbi:DedA family protein [Chromobacterium subtsugae]|mgnify:CR=1 FL=1|uniref:DedA family protein n=1 Tax=Chromobacterium subtsugae TaxID=251747 RepID=A0ABS7FGI1_9NEIS|nr:MULTISPECIES: DedA family protein [Chromobacterium]KUM05026.1 alpha-amylase [Chromobacterium subtsugae]KZE86343.1 alpha-amylase [Chromobacterium sp. F49]MBW7567966.1 DedA family protein [Chromobacterium subtsugae]MBW8289193.1 DedA family protein [Chromobacterium subtsugae]WSE92675.1 DedA family protein [Chromobacterium subtsugae]